VRGIPTLILFKDGEEVNRFVGVQQEHALLSAIETTLSE
jgi:thioredoxin-like negative regulator of GroEL